MKFRGLKQFLVVSLLVCGGGNAFAQGMSFGEDEVKQAPIGPSPVAGLLAEGKKLYGAQKYYEAAEKFYQVTLDESPSAQIDNNEAQYQLAKTLYRLGLYQSALSYYMKVVGVGETHPFFLATLNGLLELTDAIPEDTRLAGLLRNYLAYYPKDVPKRYRNRFAFLVGRSLPEWRDASTGPTEREDALKDALKAVKLLGDVEESSPDYAKAQYIAGVFYASEPLLDAVEAVKSFKNSLRWLSQKRDRGNLSEEEKRLLELGYIALGRVYYSTRQFATSLKNFNRIDRTSENWPVVLMESSWAYFQLDNFDKALGNLQSLNSPFFSDRYFPEGPILSAVLYFYNCRYDRVRGIIDDFFYEYEPLQRNLQILIDKYKENLEDAYKWLVGARNDDLENRQMERVVSASLNNKNIRDKLKVLLALDKELKELAKTPKEFQDSSVGKALKEGNEGAGNNMRFDIGQLTLTRLGQVKKELEKQHEAAERILFDIDRAEREGIQSDIAAEQAVAAQEIKDYGIKATPEQLVWTFDGEYWRDELGYYVVNIVSQCKR